MNLKGMIIAALGGLLLVWLLLTFGISHSPNITASPGKTCQRIRFSGEAEKTD